MSSGYGPIDNPLDACAKHALEELFCLDVAVDKCARQPFEALVVCQLVLLDNPSYFVDGVLLLDIHWSKEDAWDFAGLSERKWEALSKVDVL